MICLRAGSRSKESVPSDPTKPNFSSFSCSHISDVTRPFTCGSITWEEKSSQHFFPPSYNSVVRYSTPPV
ncbi:hypothetical protein lerEdw1_012487 [Lerista edwardsae]|nr:hypothetical protein lerEdw1_012487 [Lerista edwardsae]